MRDIQKTVYDEKDLVDYYVRNDIQPPERVIIDTHLDFLTTARMLDLGVGAGRSTYHFAPLVKSYFGTDYSEPMIEKCLNIFGDKYRFDLLDVRNLCQISSNSFDFILFSFNGLDSLEHTDRIKALNEFSRLLAPNGLLVFSSHNLNALPNLFNYRISFNPFITLKRFRFHLKLRQFNGNIEKIMSNRYALIQDGTHNFRIKNYYIHPSAQREQLSTAGFKSIKQYSLKTGKLLTSTEADENTDAWLYCSARTPS